jgi:DNA-binding transcriptional LysR family regulator
VAAVRHDVSGPVRLGMIGTTGRWLAPPVLAACAARHPGVRLAIHEGTSTSLVPRLADGELDAAILNLPVPDRDIAARPLFDEDLVLVVPADDPLAERNQINLLELADTPLLLPIAGTAFRDELDAAAGAAGLRLVPKAELDGVRLIASLTFEGHGPAVLPASAVPSFLQDRFRSVAIAGLPRRRVGVAIRRRTRPSAPVRAVLELLDELTAGASRPAGLHPPALS